MRFSGRLKVEKITTTERKLRIARLWLRGGSVAGEWAIAETYM